MEEPEANEENGMQVLGQRNSNNGAAAGSKAGHQDDSCPYIEEI